MSCRAIRSGRREGEQQSQTSVGDADVEPRGRQAVSVHQELSSGLELREDSSDGALALPGGKNVTGVDFCVCTYRRIVVHLRRCYLQIPGHPSILQPRPAVPHGPSDLFIDREAFYPERDSRLPSELHHQGQAPPLTRTDLHLQMVESGVNHLGLCSVSGERNHCEATTCALMLAGSPSFLKELSVCLKRLFTLAWSDALVTVTS